jgi:hypothetical protein
LSWPARPLESMQTVAMLRVYPATIREHVEHIDAFRATHESIFFKLDRIAMCIRIFYDSCFEARAHAMVRPRRWTVRTRV